MAIRVDRENMLQYLNAHWHGNKACPICQENRWDIGEDIMELRPFEGGGLATGGRIYPLVAVVCKNCGYSYLFNAVVVGMMPVANESEPNPDSSEATSDNAEEGIDNG